MDEWYFRGVDVPKLRLCPGPVRAARFAHLFSAASMSSLQLPLMQTPAEGGVAARSLPAYARPQLVAAGVHTER